MSKPTSPTAFMVNILEKMKERGLSENTCQSYMSHLLLLNDRKTFTSLAFIKSRKAEIEDFLNEREKSTQQAYVAAMLTACRVEKLDDKHLYKTIFKHWEKWLLNLTEEKDNTEHQLNESQKEAWISWEEVEKHWEELKADVDKFKGRSSITKNEYETLLSFVILSLYVKQEPRRNRDYFEMWIVFQKDPKMDYAKNRNWYFVNDNEMVFNVYKTSSHYGSKVIQPNEELQSVLRTYIKYYPLKVKEGPLLMNHAGTMVMTEKHGAHGFKNDNFLTLRLNKIFGRKIGSSMLRHIYLTHKFGPTYAEMLKTADNMGHSVAEAQSTYIRKE